MINLRGLEDYFLPQLGVSFEDLRIRRRLYQNQVSEDDGQLSAATQPDLNETGVGKEEEKVESRGEEKNRESGGQKELFNSELVC